MYAIVDIAGQQFKVEKKQRVYIHRLDANEGTKVEFDKVLLMEKDGKVQVGTPTIDGARVAATVLGHLKGNKVLVFKKKRRKGHQKMNGHRQYLTQILIQGILGKGETLKKEDEITITKKPVKKAEVAEDIAEEKETAAEVKKAPAKKKTVKKAATAKKTTTKKTTKKK